MKNDSGAIGSGVIPPAFPIFITISKLHQVKYQIKPTEYISKLHLNL